MEFPGAFIREMMFVVIFRYPLPHLALIRPVIMECIIISWRIWIFYKREVLLLLLTIILRLVHTTMIGWEMDLCQCRPTWIWMTMTTPRFKLRWRTMFNGYLKSKLKVILTLLISDQNPNTISQMAMYGLEDGADHNLMDQLWEVEHWCSGPALFNNMSLIILSNICGPIIQVNTMVALSSMILISYWILTVCRPAICGRICNRMIYSGTRWLILMP